MIDIGFDPTNLGSWVQGRSFGRAEPIVLGTSPSFGGSGCGDHECSCSSLSVNTDDGRMSCTGGTAPTSYDFAVFRQPGVDGPAATLGVFFVHSLLVYEASISIDGSRPFVLVAQESITFVDGRIGGRGGLRVASGGYPSPRGDGRLFGVGPGGGGFDLGGEGGAYCSLGGLGDGQTARRGATYGTPELAPLLGGSSGGKADDFGLDGSNAGGGVVHLIAGTSIAMAGLIDVTGENANSEYHGNGGGAGGAILLEAPVVSVNGELAADGGRGGRDGAGAGATGDSQAGDGIGDFRGGGGGFGRIRINTESGEAPVAIDALVSPTAGTGCFTQGTLAPRTEPAAPPTCGVATDADAACAACLAEHCCSELTTCVGEELCDTCFTSASPGPACGSDPAYGGVRTCVSVMCPRACYTWSRSRFGT